MLAREVHRVPAPSLVDGDRDRRSRRGGGDDTPHRFVLANARPATAVRLTIFPDGGIARLRLYGRLTEEALVEMRRRFTGP
ncbi:hypothetical protein [Glycomyces sp. TRM65418]|uniref:hypothetical protein n=1 Tax=Glycomyces sp. TRM65418 TaxID=2867006 RepID=UPI0027DF2ABE|nr:hypothetical protein [Glycomyces sp. TRM65418]